MSAMYIELESKLDGYVESKQHTERTVVNLSDKVLTPAETSLLAKGVNFAIAPKVTPKEDIIANIESAIRNLPIEKAEEIRTESARILHKAKTPKNNLSHQEIRAIKSLNAYKDVVILPADKGNATILSDQSSLGSQIGSLHPGSPMSGRCSSSTNTLDSVAGPCPPPKPSFIYFLYRNLKPENIELESMLDNYELKPPNLKPSVAVARLQQTLLPDFLN
ncbi:uncharacterized protein [Diabrotica undecimpunctata]|uniref:uncharacterized protein n=1 Tax=Diabrotica undecimpunctata TaxID=50387 RepID=UPI003B63469E